MRRIWMFRKIHYQNLCPRWREGVYYVVPMWQLHYEVSNRCPRKDDINVKGKRKMFANNNKKKEAKKHNAFGNEITELDAVIEEVKRELRSLLVKTDEQIKKIGNALKKVVKREESICEEIKIALKEEIAEGVISTRTIELHCPQEWKRKTKPRQRENEKISFSKLDEKKPPQQVAAMQEGKSVTINEITSNAKASDGINQQQLHDPSVRNAIPVNEAQIAMTNQRRSDDLKANADKSTATGAIQKLPSYPSDKQIGQECMSCLELQDQVTQLEEALQRISIPTADQIPAFGFEFIIPKEEYEMVKDAMDKSKSEIFVKCDGSKKFVRALADVDN
jgi:hypothetical protein